MSHSMEMAFRIEYNGVPVYRDSFRRNITLSQPIEIALGEI